MINHIFSIKTLIKKIMPFL